MCYAPVSSRAAQLPKLKKSHAADLLRFGKAISGREFFQVLQYCKEVLQYCTTGYCSTGSHLLLLCSTTCTTSDPWTRKMPSRSPCPKRGRSREPATAGHGDRTVFLAGAAVSPPGPQRIIAQMPCACGIQTDRSQHYSVSTVLQYEYAKESSLADGLCNL